MTIQDDPDINVPLGKVKVLNQGIILIHLFGLTLQAMAPASCQSCIVLPVSTFLRCHFLPSHTVVTLRMCPPSSLILRCTVRSKASLQVSLE